MSTFADMGQVNPEIRNEYDRWNPARLANGEDPIDWDAFRTHIVAIGQPDPGNIPPDDWVGDDYKQTHPEWWASYQSRTPETADFDDGGEFDESDEEDGELGED